VIGFGEGTMVFARADTKRGVIGRDSVGGLLERPDFEVVGLISDVDFGVDGLSSGVGFELPGEVRGRTGGVGVSKGSEDGEPVADKGRVCAMVLYELRFSESTLAGGR